MNTHEASYVLTLPCRKHCHMMNSSSRSTRVWSVCACVHALVCAKTELFSKMHVVSGLHVCLHLNEYK